MKALFLELKMFFSRDLSEYHYHDYLDLSQKSRLTILFIVGVLGVILLTYMGRQWVGSDYNHTLVMKRGALQKEQLQKEIIGLKRIQESVVFQRLNAHLAGDIDQYAPESLNLRGVLSKNNEALILGKLRTSLSFYGLSLSYLTPKRESFMLKSDNPSDYFFSPASDSRKSLFQNNVTRMMAIDFHRYFQRAEINRGRGRQQFSKSLNTQNQGGEINYPERIIFNFQTCGSYADLLAGLSNFAYQIDYIVSLDQLTILDRAICGDELNVNKTAVKPHVNTMQIEISLYALIPLHTYLSTHLSQVNSSKVQDESAFGISLFEMPLSTASLGKWLAEDQYRSLRKLPSADSHGEGRLDHLHLLGKGEDKGQESIYQRYPFEHHLPSFNISTSENSFIHKKTDPVLWRVGTKYQGVLLLGIIGLEGKTVNQYAIVKTQEGSLKTLRSEYHPNYVMALEGIYILEGTILGNAPFTGQIKDQIKDWEDGQMNSSGENSE